MSRDKGLTRRDLFSIFRRPLDAALRPPEAPAVRASPLPAPLRPPGAVAELVIADTCQRCGACVRACPRQAIAHLPEAYGDWGGTPYIVPRQAPCVLCNGLLCTTVCPSGALRPLHSVGEVRMGQATVDRGRCLPWNGQPCQECHARCPVPGAITLEQGRPTVTAACTGCGLCEHYCPTEPAAVRVRPLEADLW